jgi:periplasmic protein TonB
VFDEVTKREGGKRAAKRGVWILGSSAAQTALVVGIIAASTALAKKAADEKLVEVKFLKQAAPARPAPPPPPPAPKRKVVQQKPKVEQKPRPAMMQPKEMPQDLKLPDPNEPPEEESSDEGAEGGVVGGVVGGVAGGAPAPPPPARGPVEYNATMSPPALVAGPPLEYTQQALEREVEGTMLVKYIVRVDGTVHDCRVLRSVPFMDRAVVSVLERRRYKPATQGGQALDVDYTFTIKLKLPR